MTVATDGGHFLLRQSLLFLLNCTESVFFLENGEILCPYRTNHSSCVQFIGKYKFFHLYWIVYFKYITKVRLRIRIRGDRMIDLHLDNPGIEGSVLRRHKNYFRLKYIICNIL